MVLKQLDSQKRKHEPKPKTHILNNINSKWVIDLNVKHRRNLWELELGGKQMNQ